MSMSEEQNIATQKCNNNLEKKMIIAIIVGVVFIIVLFTGLSFVIADKVISNNAVASASGGTVISKFDGNGKTLNYISIEVPYEFLGKTKCTSKSIAVIDDIFDTVCIGDHYDGITGRISGKDATEQLLPFNGLGLIS